MNCTPQNIFVKQYMEKKLKEKALKALEEEDENETDCDKKNSTSNQHSPSVSDKLASDELGNRAWFVSSSKDKKKQKNESSSGFHGTEFVDERPPFLPNHHASTSKKVQPRSIVIPYSRVKKDRFFDWPPDPTVSKATPLPFRTEPKSAAKVLARSESNDSNGSLDGASNPGNDSFPKGLRRRLHPTAQSNLPMDLYL